MKTTITTIIILFLLTGCSGHPSHFKNIDHLKFSVCGYKNPTLEDAKKSEAQGWWGKPVEVKSKDTKRK